MTHPEHSSPEMHNDAEANSAELRAEARTKRVEDILSGSIAPDSAEAYDAYKDIVDSIRESARAGEITVSSEDQPLSEERILEQIMTAFDAQQGKIDIGANGVLLMPRAAGVRGTMIQLLGAMKPGSEPSPHAAVIEGLVREAYDQVTHPEADTLLGVEAEAPVEADTPEEAEVEVSEADVSEYQIPEMSQEVTEAPSNEQEQTTSEQEIQSVHERQVRSFAAEMGTELSAVMVRVNEYEEAGAMTRNILRASETDVQGMLQRVTRFDDYGTDGSRTVLRNMQEDLTHALRALRQSEAGIGEVTYGVAAASRNVESNHDWAEGIDDAARAELIRNGHEDAAEQIKGNGAEAVYAVMGDALEAARAIEQSAGDVSGASLQAAVAVESAVNQLDDIIRASYTMDRIDTEQVSGLLNYTRQAIENAADGPYLTRLAQSVGNAQNVLRAAAGQIENR